MKGSSFKYFAGSFFWTTTAKILNAGLKFVSIPLLLGYFGKESYGLITLAVSTNAYMLLLNMGMNTGGVKFFSQWIVEGSFEKIDRIARTSLSLYIGLGFINALLLLLLAWKGDGIFNISEDSFYSFRILLFILAGASIGNWSTFVFNQLLVSAGKIGFTQRILSIRNILNLLCVLVTIKLDWSVYQYFLVDSLLNMSVVIPYYIASKKQGMIKNLIPAFHFGEFSSVFKYSMAIFAMGIFQFTATQSRPLILGMFSSEGASILSDYRIIEVFPMFVISIGGMLTSILLPQSSRLVKEKNQVAIEKLAYEGTRYTTIIILLMCFPIIINAKAILYLYVGNNYVDLSLWLILWLVSIIIALHNSPVASIVLSTGKTKMLVFSSAFSAMVSLVINSQLVNEYGVGSAVIGYFLYVVLQLSFYYFYYNSKVLNLNSFKVFKSFIVPTLLASSIAFILYFLNFDFKNDVLGIMLSSLTWCVLFMITLALFKVINVKNMVSILRNS